MRSAACGKVLRAEGWDAGPLDVHYAFQLGSVEGVKLTRMLHDASVQSSNGSMVEYSVEAGRGRK
jgi:hypothetical protein